MHPDIEARPTIPTLLHRAATKFGECDYFASLDERMTYAEAEELSANLARRMLAAGIGKGSRVGLFFTYGRDWLITWLAASRIGALTVPISTLSTAAELRTTLRLGDVELLVAAPCVLGIDVPDLLEQALPGLAAASSAGLASTRAPYLRRVWLSGPTERTWATVVDLYAVAETAPDAVTVEILDAVESEVHPSDDLVMVHTSGSTAEPKGVIHTHGAVVRQTSIVGPALTAMSGDLPPKLLCAMPFFWVGGILIVVGALQDPVTILTLPRLEPGPAMELIERERGTAIIGWPTFTQRIRSHPDYPHRDLSSAPMLTTGPADISMMNVPARTPTHRGMSETAGSFAYTEVTVRDANGHEVAPGAEGELWVRGLGAMRGYNKRERHEIFDAEGWYRTGDRVFVNAGDPRIFFAGRFTELIKSAGANVSPREVEAVVEELDGVVHCQVVGIEHPERGEEVTAVLVLDGSVGLDAVVAATKDRLSSYKVPRRWIVTDAVRLPVLGTGKPDKRRLTTMIVSGGLD